MRHPKILLLPVVLLLSTTAAAQDENQTREATATRVEKDPTRIEKEVTRVNDILKIIGLPGIAEEAREAGVPEEDIRIIFEESEKQELPPLETEVILREGRDAARENGPIDNFGAFVQERLRTGLRGQDLAAAIHAEHKARGKGKGHDNDRGGNDNDDGEHKGKDKNNKGGKK